jgi:hypothetical protein
LQRKEIKVGFLWSLTPQRTAQRGGRALVEPSSIFRRELTLELVQKPGLVSQQDANSFYAALGNIGWIGVTFSGQRFFGHGVALNGGSAKYILVDLHIN